MRRVNRWGMRLGDAYDREAQRLQTFYSNPDTVVPA
jgi:hypothetical protein